MDTSGHAAPSDTLGDQAFNIDDLPAQSGSFPTKEGGIILAEWHGRIDQLVYIPPERTLDSVVVHDFKKIPIEVQSSPITMGHVAIIAVATAAVLEGLHYLFTKRF